MTGGKAGRGLEGLEGLEGPTWELSTLQVPPIQESVF